MVGIGSSLETDEAPETVMFPFECSTAIFTFSVCLDMKTLENTVLLTGQQRSKWEEILKSLPPHYRVA